MTKIKILYVRIVDPCEPNMGRSAIIHLAIANDNFNRQLFTPIE